MHVIALCFAWCRHAVCLLYTIGMFVAGARSVCCMLCVCALDVERLLSFWLVYVSFMLVLCFQYALCTPTVCLFVFYTCVRCRLGFSCLHASRSFVVYSVYASCMFIVCVLNTCCLFVWCISAVCCV